MLVSYEEEKNRRQVPKVKEYLSLKEYCDVMYCYLQVNSLYDEQNKIRYIMFKDCKATHLGQALDISRQTASARLKALLKTGLVQEDKINKRYILITLDKTVAELVPFSTLRVLTNTMKEKVISTYVYLLVRYRAEKQKPFKFTFEQIKNTINVGMSKSTNYIISDILLVLKKLGLLEYELRSEVQEDTGEVKNIYWVTVMHNKIENGN